MKIEGCMDFDYLILACPLTPDVFLQLGLDRTPAEIAMSSKIVVNPYSKYLVNKYFLGRC
jgi:hypothetical protein